MTQLSSWVSEFFQEQIAPDLFRRAATCDRPLWVGIGGQPGAGKTHGRDRALRLNHGEPVTAIIGDDLRAYHPDYRRLVREDPLRMPDVTAPASAAWVELALEHARRYRFNVLVEGTFRRPDVTLGTARRFHDDGYRTHLVAVAVPPYESRLSSIARFQLDHAAGRAARWTDPAAHDAGVRGTPLTLAAAAKSDAVDRISVVNRAGETLFDRARPHPLTDAARVLHAVHESTPTAAEFHDWNLRRRDVVDYLRAQLPDAPEAAAAVRVLAQDATRLQEFTSGHHGPTVSHASTNRGLSPAS